MIRTQIYLSPRQRKKVQQIAEEKEITFSEAVRDMLEAQIESLEVERKKKEVEKRRKTAGEFLLEMAEEAEKFGFSGPPDASVNHDKYIYGIMRDSK